MYIAGVRSCATHNTVQFTIPGTASSQVTKFLFLHVQRKVQVWNEKMQDKVLSNVRKVYFLLNLSPQSSQSPANALLQWGSLLWFPKCPPWTGPRQSHPSLPVPNVGLSEHIEILDHLRHSNLECVKHIKKQKKLLEPCHPCRGHPKLNQSIVQSKKI